MKNKSLESFWKRCGGKSQKSSTSSSSTLKEPLIEECNREVPIIKETNHKAPPISCNLNH